MLNENMDFMYNQLLKSYNNAKKNLEEIRSIGQLYKQSFTNKGSWNECFNKLSTIAADLSQVSDQFDGIIRKHRSSNTLEIEPSIKVECNGTLDLDTSSESSSSRDFLYTPPQYDQYAEGMIGHCLITHIDPYDKELFFINDITGNKKQALKKFLEDISKKDARRLFVLPEPQTIFGLLEDGEDYVDRVVRSSYGDVDFQVYFLDTGELKKFLKSPIKEMFELPSCYKTAPALALKCRIRFVNYNFATRFPDFLSNNLNNLVYFKIVEVRNNHLVVDLFDKNPVQIDVKLSSTKNEPIQVTPIPNGLKSSENSSDDLEDNYYQESKQINGLIEGNTNTNPFLNYSNTDPIDSESSEDSTLFKITKESLSKDQCEELFSDTQTTTNAMKAVMGYDPKDDARICRFTNLKTGKCFKGHNCKLQHVSIIKDGWTKDKDLVKTYIKAKYVYPEIGAKIEIVATHVDYVNLFYGHILTKPLGAARERKLEDLNNEINLNQDDLRAVKNPALAQLVLAPYIDQLYYRARIIDENEDCFEVFYVDYGNKALVPFDRVKMWEDRFDDLPFQAVKFTIQNILIDNTLAYNEGLSSFTNKILNNLLTARVKEVLHDELVVQIFNENGEDLGEQLVTLGFAKPKPTITNFVPKNLHMLPG